MCNNSHKNDIWLTEQCLACYSVNHIFIPNDSYHAWECYHCQNAYWLDEKESRKMYAVLNNINEHEADQDLYKGSLNIKYCLGSYEKFEVENNG